MVSITSCYTVLSLSKDQIQENMSINDFTPVTLVSWLSMCIPTFLLLSFNLNTTSLGGVGEWHRWVSGTGRAEKNLIISSLPFGQATLKSCSLQAIF